jgi:hypothetical protein
LLKADHASRIDKLIFSDLENRQDRVEEVKSMSESVRQAGVSRVGGHTSVILKLFNNARLELERIYYPYIEWSNNTSTVYTIRKARTRGVLKFDYFADNWNGTGHKGGGKVYISLAEADALLTQAEAILNEEDKDEQGAMLIKMAERVDEALSEAQQP